jgi:Werner syndrome ATP-dependent helicase
MARQRPSTTQHLENIEGFAKAQINTIGDRFVSAIVKFSEKHNISMDNLKSVQSLNNRTHKEIDQKTQDLLEQMSKTKRDTYRQFEIEKMTIAEIAANRQLVEGTLMGHLEEAIINGLAVNFKRLAITLEDIVSLEKTIRQPPINSNISSLTLIKEQLPECSWGRLRIMLALVKKKYGLCREEVSPSDASDLKQATLKVEIPSCSSANFAQSKAAEDHSSPRSRNLPTWLKRSANDAETKGNSDKETDKLKTKKKPKFM